MKVERVRTAIRINPLKNGLQVRPSLLELRINNHNYPQEMKGTRPLYRNLACPYPELFSTEKRLLAGKIACSPGKVILTPATMPEERGGCKHMLQQLETQ